MPIVYFNGEPIIGGAGGSVENDFTTDDTLIMDDSRVLGVAVPVNGVMSQEEFDAIPSEKQNHGLYIVRGEGQPLQGVTIEEYDTTVDGCDWHVRKWSNGYCEFNGRKLYSGINIDSQWGALYVQTDTRLSGAKFPFQLASIYDKNMTAITKGAGGLLVMPAPNSSYVETIEFPPFSVIRGITASNVSFYLNCHVTGRWK